MPRFPTSVFALSLMLMLTSASARPPAVAPLELHVPVAPVPVLVDGRPRLVYELDLRNRSRQPLDPTRVQVIDADSGKTLAAFEGEALVRRLDRSGTQTGAQTLRQVAAGGLGIVFIELALPAGAVPRALAHRVDYRSDGEATSDGRTNGARIAVDKRAPVAIGAPLRGGPWIAIYDPAWERGHRRVRFTENGRSRTPGRFAIDWVKLDAQGRKAAGATGLAADAYSHGEDVLAVADGTVVEAVGDLPERGRTSQRALETRGNVLVLDLGGGRFAHYGHLRPGSLKPRPGDRVRRGDKIAEVGFSGSASDPQLHFHLSDGAGAASEGVPFAIEAFRALGGYGEIAGVGNAPWTPRSDPATAPRRRELPAGNSVVMFE